MTEMHKDTWMWLVLLENMASTKHFNINGQHLQREIIFNVSLNHSWGHPLTTFKNTNVLR